MTSRLERGRPGTTNEVWLHHHRQHHRLDKALKKITNLFMDEPHQNVNPLVHGFGRQAEAWSGLQFFEGREFYYSAASGRQADG